MSYSSLRPPEADIFEESDENSIQGSPLLNTVSQFDPRSAPPPLEHLDDVDNVYADPYEHRSGERAVEAHAASTYPRRGSWKAEAPANGQDNPYADPYGHEPAVPPTSPFRGRPAGLAVDKPPTGPISGPVNEPLSSGPGTTSPGRSGKRASRATNRSSSLGHSSDMYVKTYDSTVPAPPLPAATATATTTASATARGPERPAQTIAQINDNRKSMPAKLGPEPGEPEPVPSVHSTLQFGSRNKPRPYSSLLRDSFAPAMKASLVVQDDDDDDALPFEATKQQAVQNRPLSTIHLSQMATGMVMSKDKFENYRKSLSSLDLLKREGSVISRLGRDDDAAEGEGADGAADEEDVEDEFLSSEKERKRKLAKERQKQEARMSVYRQRMTKTIGGGASPNQPSPSESRAMSTISLSGAGGAGGDASFDIGDADGDDDDDDDLMDDIPLGILQAHGFPRNRRKSTGALSTADPDTKSSSPQAPTIADAPGRPQSVASSRMLSRPASLPPPRSTAAMANVFADKDAPVRRGLVAEIAREEELRRRRNTMAVHSAHGIPPSASSASIAPSASAASAPGRDADLQELNTKINAIFDLLKGGPAAEPPSRPGSMLAVHSQAPLAQHMSQMRAVPQAQPAGSIRSFATSAYSPSLPETAFYSSSQLVPHTPTPDMRAPAMFPQQVPQPPPHMAHLSAYQSSAQSVMSPGPMSSFHGVHAASPSVGYMPYAMPPPAGLGPPGAPGPGPRVNNRPSQMRLVATEDDDDDDEIEIQKLLHKRQALRAQWREQAATSS